ncbi:hypothetical protein ACFSHT_10340 [Paraburkholderia silviterrae]|uniref:Uncharacterized protein n=1 Tax=Paraburkholderia silviterrae TaxID=2528715 RepID=A0A4R5ME07_9BURK|nr:hypothetical protein [Paraburkholderia silviterrae]TDG25350.1 hypothetical protein EYW47_05820 [Paraburkholderia silviterrae]
MGYQAVVNAKRFVQVSQRLDGASVILRNLFRACVKEARFADAYGFGLAASDVADDLRIECAHGQIRVVYDQVVRDQDLLGRFTFFLIRTDVLGEKRAEQVYGLLFNESRLATWNLTGDFEWEIDGDIRIGDETTSTLMASLLLGVVGAIPRIE